MNRPLSIIAGILVLTAIAWVIGRTREDGNKFAPGSPSLRHHSKQTASPPRPSKSFIQKSAQPPVTDENSPIDNQPALSANPISEPGPTATASELIHALGAAVTYFRNGNKSPQATLSNLREQLLRAEPEVATQAILYVLDRGEDASTGLKWLLSPAGGTLADAPTARTFMLDVLGEINPTAAADYAGKIFVLSNSPDEWALSLRNLAWDNVALDGTKGQHNASLHQHFLALIAHHEWQDSAGYYEAFDTLAYLGDAEGSAQRISSISRILKESSQIAGAGGKADAAYIALDEYSRASGRTAYQSLLASEHFSPLPHTRASLLSTTIPHSGDLALVEDYLAQPQVSIAEKKQFLALYPNYNEFAGGRLLRGNLRKPLPQSPAELDRAALGQLTALAADPRFSEIESALSTAVERLQGFVNQLDARDLSSATNGDKRKP